MFIVTNAFDNWICNYKNYETFCDWQMMFDNWRHYPLQNRISLLACLFKRFAFSCLVIRNLTLWFVLHETVVQTMHETCNFPNLRYRKFHSLCFLQSFAAVAFGSQARFRWSRLYHLSKCCWLDLKQANKVRLFARLLLTQCFIHLKKTRNSADQNWSVN